MPKKIYKKLTKEQRERGVIFSSTLSKYREEMENDIIHEVFFGDSSGEEQINWLMNDRFFNGIANYNIIRR